MPGTRMGRRNSMADDGVGHGSGVPSPAALQGRWRAVGQGRRRTVFVGGAFSRYDIQVKNAAPGRKAACRARH